MKQLHILLLNVHHQSVQWVLTQEMDILVELNTTGMINVTLI